MDSDSKRFQSYKYKNIKEISELICLFCPLVFVTLSCTFRYGRDDMDVMGIAFRRELYLATRQVYPPLQDREKGIHTRVQAKLLRKLGNNSYPFFFEVTLQRHCRQAETSNRNKLKTAKVLSLNLLK